MKKIGLCLFLLVNCMSMIYAAEVTAINNFKLDKYLGKWYEIARLPNRFEAKCIAPITAQYVIDSDNQNQLIVVNKCNTKDNKFQLANGVAYFTELPNVGKLKVTFVPKFIRWLHVGYGDYWILSVDYGAVAVVGSPDHKYLWILARTPTINNDNFIKAISLAKDQGFNTAEIVRN